MRYPIANDARLQQLSLDEARAAIRIEAEGLGALAETLDGAFVALVELIQRAPGRVVLSGVGKSAHVARKVAATLASTGTPAQFVHGADASHGDLGMITTADVVLMLSKSGATAELEPLANYCARFGIPLALMTARPQSRLGQAANIVVALPPAPEACDVTSAPTTSTTMMMALGDALAVVLLRRRGFKAADFHVFHPGGTLGSALLTVGEVMHRGDKLPLVAAEASVASAILEMTSKGFGCTGVIDENGDLLGIITDGDLRRHMADGLLQQSADAVMTTNPRVISAEALLSEALRQMTTLAPRVTAIFAMDGARPVGIVHLHDCLRVGLA
ncbi:KpsF/GutQ family sugar-phosphate isomerase [Devosia sp.]|uniref:KpsF/GutQ family sugar-phosphate isomerase n=1 Tax=Devosia sp. TaxID=1871048 RepID=UPI0025B9B1D5|nr:KpsF/GutQ family sugar-phosphate isomerase [Devosia sp.]